MNPVRYTPGVEVVADDEAETVAALIATMQRITATTHADTGQAIRGVHAKAHGLIEGELKVIGSLPRELAQGLFAHPATYAVAARISTSPGDLIDDAVSTPRGIALKIFGVPGAQLSGDPADTTQDLLLVDGPAFLVPTPKAFLGNLKLLAATTDKAEGLKKALSATLRGVESLVEAAGGQSGKLMSLGGHPATHPLGATYYSQVPVRWGDHIAKLSLVPVSSALTALAEAKVDLSQPDALRAAVAAHFAKTGGEWVLRAQLCTDLEAMPIEDASVEWPEDASPYRAVAHLSFPPQPSWDDARVRGIDDGLSFSPWHGLVDHRPLGGIMRVRRPVYAALAAERSERSGCPFRQAA